MSLKRYRWEDTLRQMRWKQGEHIHLIGRTNAGKTTAGLSLLPKRKWSIVIATKPQDSTLSVLTKQGYKRIRQWPPKEVSRKILLWPKANKLGDANEQRKQIRKMLYDVYDSGAYCIFADELRYICDKLRLKNEMEMLWMQGRSLGISIVSAAQRPRHVPLLAYDQPTHLFLWRDSDWSNVRRLSEISGAFDSKTLGKELMTLSQHDCLYVSLITGDYWVTNTRS